MQILNNAFNVQYHQFTESGTESLHQFFLFLSSVLQNKLLNSVADLEIFGRIRTYETDPCFNK
jgi:hypothetical protein